MRRSALLVVLFLLAYAYIAAQPKAAPDSARVAMDKGIIAAEIPDFPLAAKYFEEARRIDPNRAAIFYNLGMVESNIPGRELRAVCWLSAYLLREPNDPAADLIKEQIKRLVNLNAERIRELDKLVADSQAQLPPNAKDDPDGMKTAALAIANADGIQRPVDVSRAFITLAETQVESGDFAEAERTLEYASDTSESIRNVADKRFAMIDITHVRTRIRRVTAPTPIRRPDRVKRAVPTFISSGDWLRLVDDGDPTHEAALATPTFLDLQGFFASSLSSTDPQKMIDALTDASRSLSEAQRIVELMLKLPTKER